MLLTEKDRAFLDACDEDGVCSTGRMLSYLDTWVKEGISEGRFTKDEAESDLEIALYRAFALLQDDEYLAYVKAVDILEKARKNAGKSGVWHYRLSAALTHVGRLDEAREVAETGVEAEPSYPWGWLHLAKLRAHFGEVSQALVAVEHGLALVPNDPEFLQLRDEIHAGASLPVMLCHYIDPDADAKLQNLQMDLKEVLDKQLVLTCIIKDAEGFEAVKKAFGIDKLCPESDAPSCLGGEVPFSKGMLHVVFRMNEAGFSHLAPTWVKHFKGALDEFVQDGNCAFQEIEQVWLDLDRTVHVLLNADSNNEERRVVRFKVTGGLSNESAIPAYARQAQLSPQVLATLDRVGGLNEQDNYDEIIRILEKTPDAERHPVLTLELARAYNNASAPLSAGLQRAIALIESVKEQYENTFEWQFRMGYALFYLDRDDEALEYLKKAESLRKGDHDTLQLMQSCHEQITYPRFAEPFATRVAKVWETFEEKTTDWQRRLTRPDDVSLVVAEMKAVINKALPGTAVSIESQDWIVGLNLSTNNNYLNLYALRAMVRAMPESLKNCWKVTMCRRALPACDELVIRVGSQEYVTRDLYIWETIDPEGSLCLTIYSKALEELDESEADDAFAAVNLLLDHALGEIPHMRHFGHMKLSRKPEDGDGFSLPEYVRYVREISPQKLQVNLDDYLDELVEFHWERETDPNCAYLFDAKRCSTSCPSLLFAYYHDDPRPMRCLNRAGATAGVIFLQDKDQDETVRAKLCEALRACLSSKTSQSYESFGQIEGSNYAYELIFAWDLPAVLKVVSEFGEQHDDVTILGFHSLFPQAGALMIKKSEED